MKLDESGESIYYMEENGQSFRVILVYGIYAKTGAISLSLYCQPRIFDEYEFCPTEYEGVSRFSELYDVVTVNLQESETLPLGSQFVDVNNHERICEWLIENEIAEPIPIFARSGFCIYPAFKFNIPKNFLQGYK